ncbi:hypothetical protein D9756_009759 [Leucocoprinus leucothites]|uniref:Uncharacterized protein n=1 Tax=Leucocoprinus leucothites TaxID=201217 RepID=A0A8H5FTR6_9AGAR|nr:hypothetical protein D9756_009759 [Leucoagaricus leucothites]
MSASPTENPIDPPLAEVSRPDVPQVEGSASSPNPSDAPLPEKSISSNEISQDDSAVPTPSQTSPHLFFPLSASLAGKSGIPLSELIAEAGNTLTVAPDIATAEMVVAADGSFVEWPPDQSLEVLRECWTKIMASTSRFALPTCLQVP